MERSALLIDIDRIFTEENEKRKNVNFVSLRFKNMKSPLVVVGKTNLFYFRQCALCSHRSCLL
jgi:hypothetical protein